MKRDSFLERKDSLLMTSDSPMMVVCLDRKSAFCFIQRRNMNKSTIKTIATHNGQFHLDELVAIAK